MFLSKFTANGLTFSASDIANLNTISKSVAFGSALLMTLLFNYSASLSLERTKNEFLPSIQDSVGKFYPGKSIFQIFIAVVSFISLVYYGLIVIVIKFKSRKASILFAITLVSKLLSLILFANIPFDDDYKLNNNSLVVYFISSAVLMYLVQSRLSSRQLSLNVMRKRLFWTYVVDIVNAAVTFYRHQVQGVSYQYSFCSLCQWFAIGLDIYFESLFAFEINHLNFSVFFPLDKQSNHV